MTSLRLTLVAVITLPVAVPAAVASQERTFALGQPTWSLAEPLSRISGLGRLRDGRLLLADSRERLLQVASVDGRSLTPLGRNGQGPGEYQVPHAILRGLADTFYVYAGNQRYTRILGDGSIGPDLSIPVLFLRSGGLAAPRGIDSAGAIYWQGDVVGQENGQPKRREVQNVRRWQPPQERLDTVATVRDHAKAMHHHRFHPFAERDAFVVARDGRVGVLSAAEYRLRWFRDGRLVAEGPTLPHEAVPLTGAERTAFRRERAQAPAGMARAEGVTRTDQPTPQAVRQMELAFTDEMFPPTMPPFVEHGALLSPAEDLWVVRSGPAGQREARVDILGPDGRRRGHVILPVGRRLVALEADGVYLARVDADGLEWLERYAWPEGLR